ncbi:integrase [Malaciobacter marinus]|uniref:tyrosine-type recombinase/integrase n=1 Tax=Malaciobacter marinus TaxID=505249 RepID=UPI000C069A33|nr:site-specific integrase [Malaciobacter marinus]PHO11339.1 integrase [Malaciobacter marinus]
MSYINSKKYGSSVQLYQKTNGDISYSITYKDETNKLKRIKIGDKSKGITEHYCNQKRNEILHKIRLGEELPIKRKKKSINTLDKIAQVYFEDKKSDKKRISKYNLHVQPVFGSKNILEIKREDILKFRDTILDNGKTLQTAKGIIQLISTIYNYNIQEKSLKIYNPALGIKWDKQYKIDNTREKYLDLNEIKQLLDELSNKHIILLFVELSLQTGGRLETILHIQKKHINFQEGTIQLKNLKTNETYNGFLQDVLLEKLKNHCEKLKLNDYVIFFEKNKKATSRQIQSRLKPILDNLYNEGLEKNDSKNRTVIHTLRHTFASHLAINGTPIFTIKELMNHSDIEQTMRYAKLAPDSGRLNVLKLYI